MRETTPLGDADFSPGVIVQNPDTSLLGHVYNIPKSVRFKPPDRLPGRWWPMRFEVTPQGTKAFMGPRQIKENDPFSTLAPDAIDRHHADLLRIFTTEKKLSYAPTTWQPRQALGLWTTGAAFAFRKVIVEPLP